MVLEGPCRDYLKPRTKQELIKFLQMPVVSHVRISRESGIQRTQLREIRDGKAVMSQAHQARLSMVVNDFDKRPSVYFKQSYKKGKRWILKYKEICKIYGLLFPGKGEPYKSFKSEAMDNIEFAIRSEMVRRFPNILFPDNKETRWWWERVKTDVKARDNPVYHQRTR